MLPQSALPFHGGNGVKSILLLCHLSKNKVLVGSYILTKNMPANQEIMSS